jgi:8-amino-7-oxononanoate synthase
MNNRPPPPRPLPFEPSLVDELRKLDAQGLRRQLQPEPAGNVSFASNDYLGLRTDPRIVLAAQQAAEKFGTGTGASRLISGTSRLMGQLEESLSAFEGREAALVFSSGYHAAAGTITTLVGPGDEIILDKLCHASLIDGARLSGARVRTFRHTCVSRLRDLLDRPAHGRRLVITDGLFSMDGDLSPLGDIGALCAAHDAALMIDEAHGTGCLGAHGRGAAEELHAEALVHVSMGTLSKALGSQGGFICASRIVVDLLVSRARSFIYTTAPSPCVIGAALAALRVIVEEPQRRERLRERAAQLRCLLQEAGFETGRSCSQIIPVLMGDNRSALDASAFLLDRGYHCPAIRYPTVPRGTSRLRLSVTSEHTREQINGLVGALNAWRSTGG